MLCLTQWGIIKTNICKGGEKKHKMGNILRISTIVIMILEAGCPVMGGEDRRDAVVQIVNMMHSHSISSHLPHNSSVNKWKECCAFWWPQMFHICLLQIAKPWKFRAVMLELNGLSRKYNYGLWVQSGYTLYHSTKSLPQNPRPFMPRLTLSCH